MKNQIKKKLKILLKKIDINNDRVSDIVKKLGNKSIGKAGATIAGLISGSFGVVVAYQSKKLESNERESDRRKGKLDFRKSDRTGRHMIRSVVGGIPLIGVISNYDLISKRHKIDDELEK